MPGWFLTYPFHEVCTKTTPFCNPETNLCRPKNCLRAITVTAFADEKVVDVGVSAALNTLPALEAREPAAVVVKVGLEVVVNLLAVVLSETVESLSVAVSVVVTLAGWDKVVSSWLIWGAGTVVGAPVAAWRVKGVAGSLEGRNGGAKEQAIGDSSSAVTGSSSWGSSGQRAGTQGKENAELHGGNGFVCLFVRVVFELHLV